jgi:HK97 family phage prohead protease
MKHRPDVIEKRWLGDYKTPSLELRAADGGLPKVVGHAAVFGRTSQNLGGFVEAVAPGAFTKTIQEADVRGLVNHDPNIILGRNTADTLTLLEDVTGLWYEIDPPDTVASRDWITLMERGDITQSSFAFRPIDVEWGLTPDEFPLRTLKEVALYDVSPVTYPAYLDTDAGVQRQAALADLAERRSLRLEEVIDLAAHGELRDLIKDGVTRTAGESTKEREKIRVRAESRDIEPVPGSFEALSEDLKDALEEWAKGNWPSATWLYVSVNATFTDKVVATFYGSGLDYDGLTYQFAYVINDSGAITLGEAVAVDLTLTITPSDDPERSAVQDPEKREPEPEQTSTRDLSISRRRLELLAKRRAA